MIDSPRLSSGIWREQERWVRSRELINVVDVVDHFKREMSRTCVRSSIARNRIVIARYIIFVVHVDVERSDEL